MKTRLVLPLALALALSPATVLAQTDASPPPVALDPELVEQLCAASADTETELAACIDTVEAALTNLVEDAPAETQTLLDQAAELVDGTLEDLRQLDVEAALAEAVESVQDFELDIDVDVQRSIDDAVAALEGLDLDDIDVEGAIEDAVAQALAAAEDLDLQTAVDQALAEAQAAIDEADLQGTVDDAVAALEESVAEAQAIVAEAQAWARENRDAVCRGGSISLATTVGIAVFATTGVEWLGLQAFWATERFTNTTCGDMVGE